MRFSAALAIAVATFGLSGCLFGPKMAPPVQTPAKPADVRHSVQFTVEARDPTPEVSRYVQAGDGQQAPRLASKVVININTYVQERIFCIERPNDRRCKAQTADVAAVESSRANAIDPTAFVSDTERQLEKELIKAGFRVINRARLEAKLREMRDSRDDCLGSWGVYISADCINRLPDDIRKLLELYRQERAAGKLSDAEYLAKTEELRQRYRYSSAGKRRDADEMTDVSEVIRAAKDGEVGADYILLINGFSVQPAKRTINLLANPQVREFAQLDAGIDKWVRANQYQECLQSAVGIDASLVHVRTGETVWIGEYKATEDMLTATRDPLRFQIDYHRYVNNEEDVYGWVRQQNTERARIVRANMTQQPQPPAWQWVYEAKLDVVGGRCPTKPETLEPDQLKALTELAAGQLISTIRIQP